ncbi:MAG: Tryptophan-rich protein TspO [Eubacteriales bacterium SKADARSKE-1]|nr:Tryptophan-rich protein TspO [Eubacteriales bacterium SKADARSKE-1]
MIKFKNLILSIMISLGVGALSGFFSMGSMENYKILNLPKLAPPPILFPIVWSILFILMGISSYLVYESNSLQKQKALKVYAAQLLVNFIWPLIFFNANLYLLAFFWLIILWVLVFWMIKLFYKNDSIAAYLQILYLLWLTFAGYLNLMIFLLN